MLGYHSSDPYGKWATTPTDPYSGFGAQWGYYQDLETGKYLLGHRFYDSTYARFMSQDPIGQNGGVNVFSYGGNNPFGFLDPSGLSCQQIDPRSYADQLARGWERGVGLLPADCAHWLAKWGGLVYPGMADTWPSYLAKHGWQRVKSWVLDLGDIISIIQDPTEQGVRDNGHVMGAGIYEHDGYIDVLDASDQTHPGKRRRHVQGNPFHGFGGVITIWRYVGGGNK